MKKTVSVEVEVEHIRESPPGVFSGGIAEPKIGQDNLAFRICREENLQEDELAMSAFSEVEGPLQVNLFGTSVGYRELGRFFLALAELETNSDPDFHVHFDELESLESETKVHLAVHRR